MKKNLYEAISEYTIYFMAFSILGWIYETVLEVFIYRTGFSNRGVLFGPWLPVYGFGGILFLFLWYRIINRKPIKEKIKKIPLIFLLTMATATLVELITSYLCEWTMGSWPWMSYIRYAFNFQGRIALNPSIRFGLGGIIFLYIIQPLLEKITQRLGRKNNIKIAAIILIIFGIEIINLIYKKQ